MTGSKNRLANMARTCGLAAPSTPHATPGQSPLERLPYEIRAMIFEHLGYTHVYLPNRVAKRSKDEDEVIHRFPSYFRQITVFRRKQGWKSRIVAFEYEPGKWLPCCTTVKVSGEDLLVHMQGSGFKIALLWVSRTIRMEALTLLYHGATVKFGFCLQKTAMQQVSSLFSWKPRPGLPLDHFACMRRIALTEDIDKDHRNQTYYRRKRCGNPIKGLISSLHFISDNCPQLISLSIEPSHHALLRSRKIFIQKLVTAIVKVARKCQNVQDVRLGVRRNVLKSSSRWVERVKFIKLELEGFEKVHRLRILEKWVDTELGYLVAIPPHTRFLPTEVEVWS
jgi:hypothetical protein